MDHAKHTEAVYETIEKLLDIREAENNIWVQVQWTSPQEEMDVTWKRLEELAIDVPELLTEFLKQQ